MSIVTSAESAQSSVSWRCSGAVRPSSMNRPWLIPGLRCDDDRADCGVCGETVRSESSRELSGARVPKVEVELERAIRNGSWVPEQPLVDRYAVNFPNDAVGSPLNLVEVIVVNPTPL